jgi:hypothetical protein
VFEQVTEKDWSKFTKNCYYALRDTYCMGWTRDPEKNYSGSRIMGSKKHRIPDKNGNL